MTFGRGCNKPLVEPHRHRLSFRMHAAMGASAPASYDQRATGKVASVRDQGAAGSCEVHSGSGATVTACALANDPLGFDPSEDLWYKGLRAIDRARMTPAGQPLPALQDVGGQTDDSIAFMAQFGLAPRWEPQTSDGRNSDCEVATVNDEPNLAALEQAATRLFVGPYAIDPTASDVEAQVKAALAANIPVRVDTFVDSAYEDWSPGQPPAAAPDTTDPQGGGHAQYLVGYGANFYIVRNSWGTSWGDGGDALVSPAWLRATWGLYPWIVRKAA